MLGISRYYQYKNSCNNLSNIAITIVFNLFLFVLYIYEGKEQVKVYHLLKLYTFKVACQLFMSIEDHNEIEKLSTLFNIFLKGLIAIPVNLPGTTFHKATRAVVTIRKELLQIVRKRREALEQKTASPSQDILSHLLSFPDENGKFMSELVIVNNILLLLFAGHDTSTVALTLLIKRLGEHPQVYENILQGQYFRKLLSSYMKYLNLRFFVYEIS